MLLFSLQDDIATLAESPFFAMTIFSLAQLNIYDSTKLFWHVKRKYFCAFQQNFDLDMDFYLLKW